MAPCSSIAEAVVRFETADAVWQRHTLDSAAEVAARSVALPIPLYDLGRKQDESGAEGPDLIAVHGGLLNGVALSEQPMEVMTGDRNLPSDWKDEVVLDRPLVAGHKRYGSDPAVPFIVEGKFYGLDTGCVYGGCLTALRMPSGTLAQVRVLEEECYCPVEAVVLDGVGHAPHREDSAGTLSKIEDFTGRIFIEGVENAA